MTHPANNADRLGGVRATRFLLVTAPATLASLGMVAGIALGYVSVALAFVEPLNVTASYGTGDSLLVAPGTDDTVSGLEGKDGFRATALVRVGSPRLNDLCLLPRVTLPIIGGIGWLKLTSSNEVSMGEVTLAASSVGVGESDIPAASIAMASAGDLPETGGGLTIQSEGEPGSVKLSKLDAQAYGLVLDEGIRLTKIKLTPGKGDANCSD